MKDAATDEDRFGAELHDQRSISGSGDSTSAEIWHRQFARLGNHADQLIGSLMSFAAR